jgi:outer membrane protein insertion porin family
MDKKLALGIDLYRHELFYESPNNIYNETRTGGRVSLTRALGSDFLIGSVFYNLEQVGIQLNNGWNSGGFTGLGFPLVFTRNAPTAITDQVGVHVYQRVGGSIAYDTRNSTELPNHGQRTELSGQVSQELSSGDEAYYKMELTTAWYFPGFFKGHVLEAGGRAGVTEGFMGGDVPFYDRFYLGGLYSMRGYKFRNVAPRDPKFGLAAFPNLANEPIGGDNYWFGSLEYSLPIFEKDGGVSLRFALFYDIGAVGSSPYSFNTSFDDDVGAGIRINIPHLGPLRLDYGIPITHDQFNGSGGQFQFGVGYERPF